MLQLDHYNPINYNHLIERISIAEAKTSEFKVMIIPTYYITLYIPLSEYGFFYNDTNYKVPILQNILQTPVHLKLPKGSRLLGVRFYPFGIYPFSTFSGYDSQKLLVEFKLLEAQVISLINQPNDSIVPQISRIFEEFYSAQKEEKTKLLKDFFQYSFKSDASISVNSFCEKENVDYMSLYRLFKQLIGISPKKLDRLIKFRKSIDHLARSQSKLMNIAFDSGYYDHAHFVREFNYFVGMSPSDYLAYLKKENLYDFSSFTNFAAFPDM